MAQAHLRVLGEDYRLECDALEQRRLEDLAAALQARIEAPRGEEEALRRLIMVSLSLLDEAQASGAALARARGEIERLTDLLTEQRLKVDMVPGTIEERGRVAALTRWRAP